MLVDALGGTGETVTSAIRAASRTTGTTFDFLLKTAIRESALDPRAKAATSSARGLYQFIESTWLATLKEEGPKYGLGAYSAAIDRTPGGKYVVRDPAARAHILKLREDPEIAAVMAGALARRNSVELTKALGRKPTSGELYMAHFLGAAGAKRLLAMNPNASAAAAFPDAARANQSIFYRSDGSARSAREVHAALTARHDRQPARPVPVTPLAVAQLENAHPSVPTAAPKEPPLARVVFEHPINPVRTAFAADSAPVFQALFRTEAHAALSPAVRELWGGLDPTAREPGGRPLDLRQFMKPEIGRSGRRGV